MRPPAMLATSVPRLTGHRRRQIACRPGTSLGVGRGGNYLAPNQGCTGVVHLFPLKFFNDTLT